MSAAYAPLGIAIVAEVFATSMLKSSDSFHKPLASLLTICGYAISFYALSFALKTMPTGVVYAIWSGVGIVLISAASWVFYGQSLDLPAVSGLFLIIVGVLVINLFSRSVGH